MFGSDNKEVIRISRKSFIPLYSMAVVLIALIIYIKKEGLPLSEPLFIFAALFIIFTLKFTELHRLLHHYDITPTALEKVEGLFIRRTKRMHYYSISNLHLTQSLWDKLLDIGTIEVAQFSETLRTEIKNINKPREFMSRVSDMINRSGGRGVGRDQDE